MELLSVDIEKIALATIPVIIGVIVAGFLLNALGGSSGLLASPQLGFSGQS